MLIHTCDICKKKFKEYFKDAILVEYPPFHRKSFCAKCGKSILTFLSKAGLMKPGVQASHASTKSIKKSK